MELQPTQEELLAQKLQELESIAKGLADISSRQEDEPIRLSDETLKAITLHMSRSPACIGAIAKVLASQTECTSPVTSALVSLLEGCTAERIAHHLHAASAPLREDCEAALLSYASAKLAEQLQDRLNKYERSVERTLHEYLNNIR